MIKNGEMFEGETLDRIWPVSEPLPAQWWQGLEPPQIFDATESQ